VRMFFAALLAAFALLPTGSALATTYYVTPSGADTNAGTSLGTAFRTIGKLASIVNAGDVVNVKEATSGTSYNYGESVTFNRGGTSPGTSRPTASTPTRSSSVPPRATTT
jgi:hypothetical protein